MRRESLQRLVACAMRNANKNHISIADRGARVGCCGSECPGKQVAVGAFSADRCAPTLGLTSIDGNSESPAGGNGSDGMRDGAAAAYRDIEHGVRNRS